MQIIRYRLPAGEAGLGLMVDGRWVGGFPPQYRTLSRLLRLPLAEFRAVVEAAQTAPAEASLAQPALLAPIDGDTEVWAAGVTYKRSEEARTEESQTPDVYTRVYHAARPELFFKATARRVSGPGGRIAVRRDSTWDVPEPELAAVINAHSEIVGYVISNDVSSRSIEGENPLYLPQAKMYAGSCAVGPGITPVWELADPYNLTIRMRIERGGHSYWEGATSTDGLKRRLDELVEYLFRETAFPDGALLSSGTALVPESPFTLEAGDVVHISIDGLGMLSNAVVRGKDALDG